MDEQFNIENQYLMYLKKMKLNINTMHPTQKIQLRQAFYGAMAAMLVLMQGPLPDLTDEEGAKVLDSMINQCVIYWKGQFESGGH